MKHQKETNEKQGKTADPRRSEQRSLKEWKKWFRARAVSSKYQDSRTERSSDGKEDKCLHVTVTPAAL